jgi:hypothetical protein
MIDHEWQNDLIQRENVAIYIIKMFILDSDSHAD